MRTRSTTVSTLGWPNEKTFLPGEKTIMAISAPQRVQSSLAFLKRPERRFEKVTCRLLSFSIFTISIFCRPLLFLTMAKSIRRTKKQRDERERLCRTGTDEVRLNIIAWGFIGFVHRDLTLKSCQKLLSFGCQYFYIILTILLILEVSESICSLDYMVTLHEIISQQ